MRSSALLGIPAMAEGAYDVDRESLLVENSQSEFSVPHSGVGVPRGLPLLRSYHARLGANDTASDTVADLARVCISGRGAAVGAAENLASSDRSWIGRIFFL